MKNRKMIWLLSPKTSISEESRYAAVSFYRYTLCKQPFKALHHNWGECDSSNHSDRLCCFLGGGGLWWTWSMMEHMIQACWGPFTWKIDTIALIICWDVDICISRSTGVAHSWAISFAHQLLSRNLPNQKTLQLNFLLFRKSLPLRFLVVVVVK